MVEAALCELKCSPQNSFTEFFAPQRVQLDCCNSKFIFENLIIHVAAEQFVCCVGRDFEAQNKFIKSASSAQINNFFFLLTFVESNVHLHEQTFKQIHMRVATQQRRAVKNFSNGN